MPDSSILSRQDHKLHEQQLLSTARAGTQPGRTRAQCRHSVCLHHQRATFSAGNSLLKAQPEAGQLIHDIIL